MTTIKFKRGTRERLNLAATKGSLSQGEALYITDEDRIAIATSANSFKAAAMDDPQDFIQALENNVNSVVDVLNGKITTDQLSTDLGSRINLIDNPTNGLVKQVGNLETIYGTTISSAQSAAAAAQSESDAELAKAAAILAQTGAETARDSSVTAKTNAETSAASAGISANNAANSATSAAGSASSASTSATTAATSANNAGASATAASTSATNAATSATNAGNSATSASTSATTATSKAADASTSATAASTSAATATTKASEASTSATAASTSATTAGTKAGEAYTSATNAASSASNAAGSATSASTSANTAASSSDSAAGSATAASNSASAAATSATNANTSKTAAETASSAATTAKVAAESARDSASGSATAASNSASTASTKANDAGTSANSAATSATNASTSAATALTYRDSASTSASTATTKAAEATTSAGAAATSASNAAGSASAASTSASTASTKASDAAASAASASTSATTATTKAADAGVSATNSATSATNASGSATSAATSLNQVKAIIRGTSLGLPLDQWVLNNQSIVTISDGKVGTSALRLSGNFGYPNQGNFIPVDFTKTYRVKFWARPSSNAAGLLYFSLRQFITADAADPGPNNGGRSPYKPSGISRNNHITTYGDTWGEYVFDWTAADWQEGVKFFQPEFLDNYSGLAGHWDIQNFTLTDVSDLYAAVETEAAVRASADNSLFAKYTVKIDNNGYVSGFGLASTANNATPFSDFLVRADKFSIASPSGPDITPVSPFIVYTTPTEVNGITVQPGVYIKSANIETITADKLTSITINASKYIKTGTAAISGTTMTGAGSILNGDGTVAIGNATTNISFNGTQMTLNGNVVNTSNMAAGTVTSANNASTYSNLVYPPATSSNGGTMTGPSVTLTTSGSTGSYVIVTITGSYESNIQHASWNFMSGKITLNVDGAYSTETSYGYPLVQSTTASIYRGRTGFSLVYRITGLSAGNHTFSTEVLFFGGKGLDGVSIATNWPTGSYVAISNANMVAMENKV